MKKTVIILFVLFSGFNCFSQSAFDKTLKSISNDLAGKLKLQGRKKLVVLFITDINRTNTTAGKYLADNISYNFVNDTVFNVFERENLANIEEVKELIKEGYIDAEKTKKLGKILSVNAIIVGSYTVLSNTIKLSIKALSSNNGATIAASMMDLPLNADAGALLGIKIRLPGDNASKDPKCKEKNTGDYCFQNNTQFNLQFTLSGFYKCTIKPNEKQCFYDLQVGSLGYDIIAWKNDQSLVIYHDYDLNYKANGQIYVEQCTSKTFIIR